MMTGSAEISMKRMIMEILAELYRGLNNKDMETEKEQRHFETYHSGSTSEIRIKGVIEKLSVRAAFNEKLVVQYDPNDNDVILYLQGNWKGNVILEGQPESVLVEEKLKQTEFHIVIKREQNEK